MNKKLNSKRENVDLNRILVINVPFGEKSKQKFHGWTDGSRENVIIINNGYVESPHINNQTSELESKLAGIWKAASIEANKYKDELEYEESRFDDLLYKYYETLVDRHNAIRSAKTRVYKNENSSSDATLAHRINNRIKKQASKYDIKLEKLKRDMDQIAEKVSKNRTLAKFNSCRKQAIDLQNAYISTTKASVWIYLNSALKKNPNLNIKEIYSESTPNNLPININLDSQRNYDTEHNKQYCFHRRDRMLSEDFQNSYILNKKLILKLASEQPIT